MIIWLNFLDSSIKIVKKKKENNFHTLFYQQHTLFSQYFFFLFSHFDYFFLSPCCKNGSIFEQLSMSDKRISNQFLEKSFFYNTRLSNFIALKRNNSHIQTENKNEMDLNAVEQPTSKVPKHFFLFTKFD